MTSVRRASKAIIVAITPLLSSCDGSDDDGPTGSEGSEGSFTIVISPPSASLQQTSSTSITVTLTRSGGFSGVVTLTISGSPTGVSATMDPAVLSGNTVQSRIDLTASANAALGASTITVTGASGARQSSATFALTVDEAPDYALSVHSDITVAAGGTLDVTVNIDRLNFTGGVTLSLVNPPAGITGAFTPVLATSTSAILSLTVGSSVAPGIDSLMIRGIASGLTDRTRFLPLRVIPSTNSSSNVEYQFCQPDDVPAFFAYQDGNGAWQAVNGTTSGGVTRFGFRVNSGRGGIFLIYPFTIDEQNRVRATHGSRLAAQRSARRPRTQAQISPRVLAAVEAYETIVFRGSTTELAEDGVLACGISPPSRTIRGTVAGLANFQYSVLTLGNVTRIIQGGVNTNPVTFNGVERDQLVFLGSRLPSTGSAPDRAVLFRNLSVPDGGTLPSTIDFNGPSSFAPASATVTITGASGDRFEVYNHVHTASGPVRIWNDIAPSQVSSRPWAGLPPGKLAAGEFHDIFIFASPGNNSEDFRVARKYVGAVSNQTVAFGPPVNPATASLLSADAYPRFRFHGELPPDYNKGVFITVSPDAGNYVIMLATNAWLTASGTPAGYDLTMPDVAGLPGFPTVSRLQPGVNFVTTEAFGFTGPGSFEGRPVAGTEARTSIRIWPIQVP